MTQGTTVTAACGTVNGLVDEGIHVFRGIPYAQQPIGDLRFAAPLAEPAVADIDATRFGAISMQDLDPLPAVLPGTEFNYYSADARQDEQCLNLNVWTADPAGKAPVFVFIHGGAWLCGSGSGDWADGAHLARAHGIVVVTINYRLGILGGLWLGDYDPQSSNLSIQDQAQALRWVRENIEAFGGDPNRVTVGGESAGAISALALLGAPGAQGLFHRAVVESGHMDLFVSVADARRATRAVLERLHIDPDGSDVLTRLRETSTLRIADVQRSLGNDTPVRIFPLVTDGVTIDRDPLRSLGEGRARGIDLMIGSNSEESRLFTAIARGWAERSIPEAAAQLLTDPSARLEAIEMYSQVAADSGIDAETTDHMIATDHAWAEPVRTVALAHATSGGRTYHYEFAWSSRVPMVGAAHLVDLPFFLGTLGARGVSDLLGDAVREDPATIALGEDVSATVAMFVQSGDLSASPLGSWPLYTDADRATMVIDRQSHVESHHLGHRVDFWASQRGSSAQPFTLSMVEE